MSPSYPSLTPGAVPTGSGTSFRVWAPHASQVEVVLERGKTLPMPAEDGYFVLEAQGVRPGARYRLDGAQTFPDPASRFQPEGVHGPSEVVDARSFTFKAIPKARILRREKFYCTFLSVEYT